VRSDGDKEPSSFSSFRILTNAVWLPVNCAGSRIVFFGQAFGPAGEPSWFAGQLPSTGSSGGGVGVRLLPVYPTK
jgi:hypothetical protein